MLLLHHDLHEMVAGAGNCTRRRPAYETGAGLSSPTRVNGASGRTRTDDYDFTKVALWLLRHGGTPGTPTRTCTSNFLLRREACISYTLGVSNWCAMPVLPRRLMLGRQECCTTPMAHESGRRQGVAPCPSALQTDALLRELYDEMVCMSGVAPESADYRSAALLLSYMPDGTHGRTCTG